MLKINLKDIPETHFKSPKGKFEAFCRDITAAFDGPSENQQPKRPFELELVRLPPGASLCPYHVESAQWELYLVVSGRGTVRHVGGTMEVTAGDSFVFGPGEAHQHSNQSDEDFVYYVMADNPIGDSCFYPDSNKWSVRIGEKSTILQHAEATYFDGEE